MCSLDVFPGVRTGSGVKLMAVRANWQVKRDFDSGTVLIAEAKV